MFKLKKYFIILALFCFIASANTSYADDAAAMNLIQIQGCKGCHRLNEEGGILGPALDGVGNRLTYEQIKQKILYPEKQKPASLMPDYRHLTPIELDQLIDYLASRR